jgi:natural product biosynthesis luciferase-like monooxygenase protein
MPSAMSTANTPPPEAVLVYPLSPLQHGMLFHSLQAAEPGVDIEQLEGRFHETIDHEAFARAWGEIAARHDALRTRFRWEGLPSPRQEVVASVATPFASHDLGSLGPRDREARVAAFLVEDRRRGFDLGTAPLWRVTLFRLADAEHRMVWTYSHAILDSCFAEVLREVFAVLEAGRRGGRAALEARRPYADHIAWLEENLRARADDAKRFWRERLAGFVTPTTLDALQIPAARAQGTGKPSGHDTVRLRIPRAASDAIRAKCAAHGLRVATFVEAAWALVLSAFSGEDDVVFGSTRACRRSSVPGAEAIVGLFINTLPVRTKVAPEKPLLAWLRELRANQVALRPFEHTPLVDVLACAEVPRASSLFETIVVFNERDNDARLKAFGEAWKARDFELHDQTNFPFNVMAYGEPEIAFKLSFDRQRFERRDVQRIASLLGALLERMGEVAPEAAIGDLPRLPEEDAQAILGPFNDTRASVGGPSCIHEAFEAQVDKTPDAVAVVFRGSRLTYRELEERSNLVAQELIALGVGPDVMVGIFVERSLEMIIGLLGILKAGGAYVPMDPSYPRDRIETMLEDTRAPVVLTLQRLLHALPAGAAEIVTIDRLRGDEAGPRPSVRAAGRNLAYVIFTSGSTGRPKGVQIEHRNAINFFAAMDAALGTTPGVWLALTSISFDISVLELFWTLARGFTVIVQEDAERAAAQRRAIGRAKPISFSLFYFAADAGGTGGRYRLLLEGAKFADTHGFEAIWTPERHFHPFGGLYPNPSVTSAAIAAVTERIAIRAGSVVLPLHNPIRCAEEWSVVDNLSNGRVGLSFASGWHASDFALAPANFEERRELMARGIETVKALWRGEAVPATSGDGKSIQVKMYPPPVQREPRIWVTASGNPETFAMAGRMGASILTNLLVMKPEELVANAAVYRQAYRDAGHPGSGHVTLMLHTFVGADLEDVRARVRGPFLEYLRTSTDLINKARWELTAFAKADDRKGPNADATMDLDHLSPEDMDAILAHAFERYFSTAGLFGTPDTCMVAVERLRDMGVDEVACLVDFGLDTDVVLASLVHLDELRQRSSAAADGEDYTIAAQIRRHGVTHMQCTPSLLGMLAIDGEALAALGSLRQLLVGGEALAPALVARVRSAYRGTLRNMYGPTETTVWSTTAAIADGTEPVTIGRPIANTRVYVVDLRMRPLPIGVPGELLIGGAGVVRGYLERPELTAERFVSDPFGEPGDRLYRTGDLARWLPTGELEFLGRCDHQVKIRGYRIELGEIEAVLAGHPSVRECVVVAWAEGAGHTRLVAYVVPRSDGVASAPSDSRGPSPWETIWDETYKQEHSGDGALNAVGWKSSYDDQPIPEGEMREWVESSAARILGMARASTSAPRVLEVGCGTGMVLLRVAPSCAHYTGIDFSEAALAHVAAEVRARSMNNVTLERRSADDLGALTSQAPFDAVILNSVVQYFPDADYLAKVLLAAYGHLAPGGAIFVGDVRSLAHLYSFHVAIELARSPASATIADLEGRVRRRRAEESELVLDPTFFEALSRSLPDVASMQVDLRPGRAKNEMTRFRYDVVLRKAGAGVTALTPPSRSVTAPEPFSRDAVRALLMDRPTSLVVRDVRNARLADEVLVTELLAAGRAGATVDELRAIVSSSRGEAIEPDDLRTIHPEYDVTIAFSPQRLDRMDATFRHRSNVESGVAPHATNRFAFRSELSPSGLERADRFAFRSELSPSGLERADRFAFRSELSPSGLERADRLREPSFYANQPARPASTGQLVPSLRTRLREKLPEYMMPNAFVVLDAMPLTPNGKVDRGALPAPDRARHATSTKYVPPASDLEQGIAGVLQELLGVDEVGRDDNFFDLGANSLMMVQASVRLRAVLRRDVSLVQMFQFPSIRSLAGMLGSEDRGEAKAAKEGHDRAQARRDAMARRREMRQGH